MLNLVNKPVITMSTLGQNGRFANQLFQYAFLKIYAREHNLRIETPAWIGQYLFGHNEPLISKRLPLVIEETNELTKACVPKAKIAFKNVDFWGYFQYHTKYYAPHKEYFRSLFRPVAEIEKKMTAALERLRFRGKTVVGLHLRRGDYGYEDFFIAPSEWYKECLKELWETLDEPVLFIASDEIEKVRGDFIEYNPVTSQELGVELAEADFYPDFYLLSRCDIVAISNSSFSFVACMLNERANLFFRPYLAIKKLIPFDPWNSEPILRNAKVPDSVTVEPVYDFSNSVLNGFIPPEIKDDEFYADIQKIAREENIKTVLEIGSSSGEGSTEAFVTGLRENPNKPILFCMEVSKARFAELQKRYVNDWFVKCYNYSSVSLDKFPQENEVINFYTNVLTGLNLYPLDQVLDWLRQDIKYIEQSGVSEKGIKKIKEENAIHYFDVVLIDGSEFTGSIELDEVYGAKLILLDDINTFKNYRNYHKLIADPKYALVKQNPKLRNGYAIFKLLEDNINTNSAVTASEHLSLPIHFLTIVLNGEPFIRYHIEVFQQLPFKWHWHIVEGVADLKYDTAWVLQSGGRIIDEMHCNGCSNDGTTEYLDELARKYTNNITVYRQPEGVFWDGKREMVNAPLANIHEECLLWQVDADELWTVEQICTVRQLFTSHPEKTAAFYWCWYFVGEELIVSTRNCYAQNPYQEWLRTWRFKPGAIWASHEPPQLVEPLPNGEWRDVATVNPFLHQETEYLGLIFQHFAYVTQEQLRFKEQYYGYKNAVFQWKELQAQTQFPVRLSQYFSWVQDATQVDTASSWDVLPIARRKPGSESWQFLKQEEIQRQSVKMEKSSVTIIVDGVFQSYRPGITRVWKSLLEEWANNGFAKHIIVLDRGGVAPKISGIRYFLMPLGDENFSAERDMLQRVCDREAADLFISTYYTAPISTPSVLMIHDLIPEVLEWDAEHPSRRVKHHPIQQAAAYIAVSENTAADLVKFFPHISQNSITVAHNGVHSNFSPAALEEVNHFKAKYGISKPYFILVGLRTGYKNTILFFKAFSQLCSKQGFEIVCIGGESLLETEFRNYTVGIFVHMLQLSDEELRAAYSGAIAVVYPSKYEGFGLPVLEAIACGCPVITCPNGAIPEVLGIAALYVNDNDVHGLANALCEVQKPDVRTSLIAAGIQQAKNFSWSKMAKIVSSALIDATLLPLKLKDLNLIIFPDWTQPEESLSIDLERVIRAIINHPDKSQMTLLVDTSNIADEDANLLLSGVTMNLIMQEDLDVTEEPEISLIGKLGEIQWSALLPRIQARIILERENKQAIAQIKAETLLSYEIESFRDKRKEHFWGELSYKLFQEGRWQEAINQYQKIIETKTGDPELYWQLSECFRHLNLPAQAFRTLREGIKLYQTEARLHFSLIFYLQTSGRIKEAIVSTNIAAKLLPNDYTFQILNNLILPIIYETQDEISFYRQRFIKGLQNLIQQTSLETAEEKKDALAGIGRLTNFYLAHQGQNDLELQCQYGNLVHKIMTANYPKWVAPLSMPLLKEHNKIRVGYVSAYLHSYSGTLWLTGWLRYCDRQNFEIYCYYTGNEPDAVTQQFQNYSDAFHHIPHNLEAACEQIIADQLHILVFPEIGMDPQTIQMAGLRLAPVQCLAWGHPVTSGLPTVDYFLSSELMEPENAQEHYSETLIRLPNIGVAYPKPYIPPLTKTRADFQLRDDAVIYLCCQAPFKYLPQYDLILAEIARRVPQAQFVFLRGSLIRQRLSRAFAAVGLNSEDYCVFLTIPERLDYLMINLLSDIYLDTITWSGGNTSLEAIACHLPIVTYAGEFMRGLHSYSFLKMIGVTDTIAQTEVEYVEIAVKLGLEPSWRREIVNKIKECHNRVYDDQACVTGLEAFYKHVVQEAITQGKH